MFFRPGRCALARRTLLETNKFFGVFLNNFLDQIKPCKFVKLRGRHCLPWGTSGSAKDRFLLKFCGIEDQDQPVTPTSNRALPRRASNEKAIVSNPRAFISISTMWAVVNAVGEMLKPRLKVVATDRGSAINQADVT
jgi:hypothetical protein